MLWWFALANNIPGLWDYFRVSPQIQWGPLSTGGVVLEVVVVVVMVVESDGRISVRGISQIAATV